jgi:hypothetical protein
MSPFFKGNSPSLHPKHLQADHQAHRRRCSIHGPETARHGSASRRLTATQQAAQRGCSSRHLVRRCCRATASRRRVASQPVDRDRRRLRSASSRRGAGSSQSPVSSSAFAAISRRENDVPQVLQRGRLSGHLRLASRRRHPGPASRSRAWGMDLCLGLVCRHASRRASRRLWAPRWWAGPTATCLC